MDTLERNQVSLILEHLSSETLRGAQAARETIKAEHSASGTLQSGATVKRMAEAIEQLADSFIEGAVDQVSGVAQDTDAYNAIASNLTALLRGLQAEIHNAIMLTIIGHADRLETVAAEGEKLFNEARARIFKKLEIYRFSFTKPSKGDLAAQGISSEAAVTTSVQPVEKRNPGGKPLAAHWDAMWAAIAVKLWVGDLRPNSQADVKRAMFDWFNEAEVEVGDTVLTQRARQLWQAMQDADS